MFLCSSGFCCLQISLRCRRTPFWFRSPIKCAGRDLLEPCCIDDLVVSSIERDEGVHKFLRGIVEQITLQSMALSSSASLQLVMTSNSASSTVSPKLRVTAPSSLVVTVPPSFLHQGTSAFDCHLKTNSFLLLWTNSACGSLVWLLSKSFSFPSELNLSRQVRHDASPRCEESNSFTGNVLDQPVSVTELIN